MSNNHKPPKVEGGNAVVPIVLGGAAIGIFGYIIYKVFFGTTAQTLGNLQDQWKTVYDDYVQEYKQYVQQTNGALTQSQQDMLTRKQSILTQIDKEMATVSNQTVSEVILAVAGVAALAILLKYFPSISKALSYWKTNVAKITDSNGLISLTQTTINVAFAESGNLSIATAAQSVTQYWAATRLYPAMQSSIYSLQSQLATLTGIQLTIATSLINSMQTEIATTIPTLINMAPLYF